MGRASCIASAAVLVGVGLIHHCRANTELALAGKRVLLLRHGRTEMNDFLTRVAWDAPDFVDPMLFDTRLTEEGRAQARLAAHALRSRDDIELVVCSPLSRALATHELAFARNGARVPMIVLPLAAERRFHASDLGRPRPQLEAEFPGAHIDWSLLPQDGTWGYPALPAEEPEADFVQRMAELRAFLAARPERTIAVVAHWGVIHALTGKQAQNCELLDYALDELRPGTYLLDAVT